MDEMMIQRQDAAEAAARESYVARRASLETYFDRTAVDAWSKLTSNVKVSGIRATVRRGRDETRRTLINWMPSDMAGRTLYDAGCGTGLLAVDAARRGAHVFGIDLSANLIDLAKKRLPSDLGHGRIELSAGDMLAPEKAGFPAQFDHVVAMDSLIHYDLADIIESLSDLAAMARESVLFTVAPRTPMLSLMHMAGRFFPRDDRAPAIVPVAYRKLAKAVEAAPRLAGWKMGRRYRIDSGFYISHALEIVPK